MPDTGPALHLHLSQEEWFYVMEGEVRFQVGERRMRLGPGESILAPRRIPHTFSAFGSPAHMLIAFTPADKMEQYFIDAAAHPSSRATRGFHESLRHAMGRPLAVLEVLAKLSEKRVPDFSRKSQRESARSNEPVPTFSCSLFVRCSLVPLVPCSLPLLLSFRHEKLGFSASSPQSLLFLPSHSPPRLLPHKTGPRPSSINPRAIRNG